MVNFLGVSRDDSKFMEMFECADGSYKQTSEEDLVFSLTKPWDPQVHKKNPEGSETLNNPVAVVKVYSPRSGFSKLPPSLLPPPQSALPPVPSEISTIRGSSALSKKKNDLRPLGTTSGAEFFERVTSPKVSTPNESNPLMPVPLSSPPILTSKSPRERGIIPTQAVLKPGVKVKRPSMLLQRAPLIRSRSGGQIENQTQLFPSTEPQAGSDLTITQAQLGGRDRYKVKTPSHVLPRKSARSTSTPRLT
ncbi:expressed protein, partial [Phakopsora pachyrhizi]